MNPFISFIQWKDSFKKGEVLPASDWIIGSWCGDAIYMISNNESPRYRQHIQKIETFYEIYTYKLKDNIE